MVQASCNGYLEPSAGTEVILSSRGPLDREDIRVSMRGWGREVNAGTQLSCWLLRRDLRAVHHDRDGGCEFRTLQSRSPDPVLTVAMRHTLAQSTRLTNTNTSSRAPRALASVSAFLVHQWPLISISRDGARA